VWVACTLVVLAFVAGPAPAQSLRPAYPVAPPAYARVTITNQTDMAIVFHAHWGAEEPRRYVVEPGRAVTLETTFAPLTPKPEVTVTYRIGRWYRRPGVLSLPSGHVDPNTDNPGRVYDFYEQRSNAGEVVTLTAR